MKILNLYAGIGGNRKLWGDEHEITAVEIDAEIAEVYGRLYPNDTVVVADAHQADLDRRVVAARIEDLNQATDHWYNCDGIDCKYDKGDIGMCDYFDARIAQLTTTQEEK